MGPAALKSMSDLQLGDVASVRGHIPMGASVVWATELLSVALQKGSTEMYRRSEWVLSRGQDIRYDPGLHVPVSPYQVRLCLWLQLDGQNLCWSASGRKFCLCFRVSGWAVLSGVVQVDSSSGT